jgi:DNA-binding transcriptional MerR regulator
VSVAIEGFTIGEVLNRLKQEFEDISISKIRFLESEGLIYPDRTESGYRKFSDDDVDRLRFILTAQRDHYLPLKVIREQLERVDAGVLDAPVPNGAVSAATLPGMDVPADNHRRASDMRDAEAGIEPRLGEQNGQAVLGMAEFCESAGLEPEEVRALKEYGLLAGGGDEATPFDADDLMAARAARDLLRLGLEPRHMRMYALFVAREVALFEQLVVPLLRQHNPEAKKQATRLLETLSSATGRMRRALLGRELRHVVSGK